VAATLPLYAELQRGEVTHAGDHVAHGVPSLPVSTLPARYAELVGRELPLERDELDRLRAFAPRLEQLCVELASDGLSATVQHDDLHMANVYEQDGHRRLLDWGTARSHTPSFRSW
jgi:predicted trehalose synthase